MKFIMRLPSVFVLLLFILLFSCSKDNNSTEATIPVTSYAGSYGVYQICRLSDVAPVGDNKTSDTTNSTAAITVNSDTSITYQGQVYNCSIVPTDTATGYLFVAPNTPGGYYSITFPNPYKGVFGTYSWHDITPAGIQYCSANGVKN